MGTRSGWLGVTAALTTACWICPPDVAAAGKSTIEAAGIVQQRGGLIAAWTVADAYGPLRRPGFGLEAGFHLSDPNRQGEPYILLGIETYFDLD